MYSAHNQNVKTLAHIKSRCSLQPYKGVHTYMCISEHLVLRPCSGSGTLFHRSPLFWGGSDSQAVVLSERQTRPVCLCFGAVKNQSRAEQLQQENGIRARQLRVPGRLRGSEDPAPPDGSRAIWLRHLLRLQLRAVPHQRARDEDPSSLGANSNT